MRKNSNNKKPKSLRIMLSALVCMTLSERVKSASKTLTEILQEYCVPSGNGYCSEKATYTNGKCECGACGLYYDKTTRSCKECPAGSYVNDKYSTECIKPDCGIGSYGVLEVGKNDCSVGYYKVTLSTCK